MASVAKKSGGFRASVLVPNTVGGSADVPTKQGYLKKRNHMVRIIGSIRLPDLHACTALGNLPIALLHDNQPLLELFRERQDGCAPRLHQSLGNRGDLKR